MATSGRSVGPGHNGRLRMLEGRSFPLGATVYPDGVNFSVFSRDADTIELLLFDRVDDARASRIIPLAPKKNQTYHYWHVFVPDLGPGQIYGYRAIGPHEPSKGLLYDPEKLLHGTQQVFTKSAASLETAGRNGMENSGTMSEVS